MDTKTKNFLIGGLVAVVLIMAIGYAAFAQQLNINGTATIASKWDVHIKSITPATPVGTAKSISATVDNNSKATFNTELVSPGDSLTYTVVVENSGTLDATVADNGVIFNEGSNNQAIKYTYSEIATGTKITQGSTISFTITITYDDSITSQPASDQLTNTLEMILEFEQDA